MNTILLTVLQAMLDEGELLGVRNYEATVMSPAQSIADLALRFFLNLIVCWVIVHFFYYRKSKRRDYYFTFLAFSSAMLLLLFMMGNVEVGVGLTLGLFAIFGVIRYRTETVPIREMTYLFVIIALAAINGLSSFFRLEGAFAEDPRYVFNWSGAVVSGLANLLMMLLVLVLESGRFIHHTASKIILYDRIELIVPEKRKELLEDIEKRTGIKPKRIEIGHVDFLKDAAYIKLYYSGKSGEPNTIGDLVKPKQFMDR